MLESIDHTAYEKIKKQIHFHNYRYHVLDAPLISDLEFDRLLVDLRKIEKDHPEWVSSDSPTQRAGAPISEKFAKVHHPAAILSLANAFNPEEVTAWYERVCKLDERVQKSGFVVEPKIDGLTVVLTYTKGIFTLGATRGDGEIGEDITSNLRTIPSIPLRIPLADSEIVVPEKLVVRAEAFIKIHDFEILNKKQEAKGEKAYQNPRNTAAGALRQLDPALTASRPLTILTYAIVDGIDIHSQWESLNTLKMWGFPVTEYASYYDDITQVLENLDVWQQRRDSIPFEIDGIVIKIDDLHIAKDLGVVGKDPRGAIALKFPAHEVTTLLKEIKVNVGRTGVLTPYAVLEPVEIGGVVVKQATLHNFDYIKEKDLRVGDKVLLKRAGDVIPYIVGSIPESRDGNLEQYTPPNTCPTCNQPVRQYQGEVALYCINALCPAQVIRNIEHFVSRSAMNIDGLGIRIVEMLVSKELLHDAADLYALNKSELLQVEGFAQKKAVNLLEAIAASKSQPLNRLIYALGIHGVGEAAALELANKFEDVDALAHAGDSKIQMLDGFGPNTALSIVDWFAQPRNKIFIEKLRAAEVWPRSHKRLQQEVGALKGLTFVITGTLETFTREQAKEFIQSQGGKTSESISRTTDYLIAGEEAGSKLEKARTLGIKVITEQDLRAMVTKYGNTAT